MAASGEAHSCPECQTTLAPWEGQPAPRLYGFSAKDVAWALTQVAGGATYRSTAAAVRERAGRELSKLPGTSSRGGKLPPATQHGQLISDWVEIFAPVIWSHYAPKTWPRKVLLDEDTLKYSQLGKPRGLVAFYVLAVMAYTDAGRPFVAAVEAVPRVNRGAWGRFLRTLPGQPFWAVTDGGGPVTGGARNAWPDVEMWRCEWHLLKNLRTPLPRDVRDNPADPLNGRLRYAQLSPENWTAYRADLLARSRQESGFAGAVTMAAKLDALISEQAASRPDDLPLSTGPLEQFFRTLDATLGDRAAKMTNKRRADALLKLLAAKRNGWVHHDRWTALIRQHLDTRRGRPADQRQHTDARTAPSLR